MPKQADHKQDRSNSNHPTRTTEVWELGKLSRNPRQDSNFHPLSDVDLAALADDMKRNGQQVAIEVTPDGRVVDGHQRWDAAKILGWSTLNVVVRHDLAGDEAAIERRLIEANLSRRQLGMLDRVRLAVRLAEIKQGVKPGGLSQCQEQTLREQVSEKLGASGRTMQRWLNLLKTPMEVQKAVSQKKIPLLIAEKVAWLDDQVQARIAAEIRAGGKPTRVVTTHLPKTAPTEINPDREYLVFLKAVTHANQTLDGREDRVRGGSDLDSEIKDLKKTKVMIDRLIQRHESLKKRRAQTRRDFGLPEI